MGNNLLKAGEFAKLCGKTRHTLIHYDDLGLLKPARTGENGYRYYSLDEYVKLRVISVLADTGFALGEIARLFDQGDPATFADAASDKMYALDAAAEKIARDKRILSEMHRQLLDAQIQIKRPYISDVPPMTLLIVEGFSEKVPTRQQLSASIDALEKLESISPEALLSPLGAKICLDDACSGVFQYSESFFVLPFGIKAMPNMKTEQLPAKRYALLDYDGPWSAIGGAYARLKKFIEDSGEKISGPVLEIERCGILGYDWSDDGRYLCRLYAPLD